MSILLTCKQEALQGPLSPDSPPHLAAPPWGGPCLVGGVPSGHCSSCRAPSSAASACRWLYFHCY